MTTLVLVRHGQASFASRNYDKLSETGVRQSLVLGAHWKDLGVSFDVLFSGQLERQFDTARHAVSASGTAASVSQSSAFDEYDHQTLIRSYLPLIAREHPEFGISRRELINDRKQFQRFFEKVIACWLEDREGEIPVSEKWDDFRRRVVEGVRTIAPPGTRTAAVFTSGGVITALLQEALNLDARDAFALNWRIYNASVHTFRIGRRGLTLTSFNNVSHLELEKDPELLTFR